MTNSSNTFTIRAHHLLCLQGFQGYGYNEDFVANMKDVIQAILSTPDTTQLKLVSGQDDFCTACPHHGGTVCKKDATADARMKSMDNATLEKLNLTEDVIHSAQDLIALSNKVLKTTHDVKAICGLCEWREKCLWHNRLLTETDKNF